MLDYVGEGGFELYPRGYGKAIFEEKSAILRLRSFFVSCPVVGPILEGNRGIAFL